MNIRKIRWQLYQTAHLAAGEHHGLVTLASGLRPALGLAPAAGDQPAARLARPPLQRGEAAASGGVQQLVAQQTLS